MKYLIFFAALYLCYYVLKKAILPVLRTYKEFKRYREPSPDKELVQDPSCHTYIPRDTALRATIGGEIYYFCSQKCLEEYRRSS